MRRQPRIALSTALFAISLCLVSSAYAGGIAVIYTEIVSHSSGLVPGAKGPGGVPVVTNWLALEDLAVRDNGAEWVVKGRTTQATTNDSILVRGAARTGTAFAQDGQPLLGGAPGEQYDFFDSPIPAAWNDQGDIAFGARAKGGNNAVFEKVIKFSGGVHTIVAQMGDPVMGLTDLAPAPSGDELLGNSINSIHLRNDGIVGYTVTPITNLHSSRYPAIVYGHTAFKHRGVSPVGGSVWDGFTLAGGFYTTPDNAHFFVLGDDAGPTATDRILLVDEVVVMREGSPVAGAGTPTMSDVFFTRMLTNGDWFARGADPTGADWAVRNGVLLAKTGDLIGGGELWGDAFSSFTGDRNGNWLLVGNTSNPNPSLDTVMVYNGTMILAREGDPIDLDDNGLFDDDVFLASFQPNDVFLTDDGLVYFLATLRNGAGTGLGDAFLRLPVPEPTTLVGVLLGAALIRLRRRS